MVPLVVVTVTHLVISIMEDALLMLSVYWCLSGASLHPVHHHYTVSQVRHNIVFVFFKSFYHSDTCSDCAGKCVTRNSTDAAQCLPSCFINNGGCQSDQICTSIPAPECSTGRLPCSSVPTGVQCSSVNGMLAHIRQKNA